MQPVPPDEYLVNGSQQRSLHRNSQPVQSLLSRPLGKLYGRNVSVCMENEAVRNLACSFAVLTPPRGRHTIVDSRRNPS